MGNIYVCAVGIDAYPAGRHRPLYGCVNDARSAAHRLASRADATGHVRLLTDAAATRRAVISGIEEHLGHARAGDTAVFWFAGHGSQIEATAEQRAIEATGYCQALVCVDQPLLDKDLGPLLDTVAARGAAVVAVLDCCYSGGGTRDEPGEGVRWTPPDPDWPTPPAAAFRDAADAAAGAAPVDPLRHLLLAGSRLNELCHESVWDGRTYGVFSHALLSALTAADGDATGREVFAAAAAAVERSGFAQHPTLVPDRPGGPADRPFLGGAAAGVPAPHMLSRGRDGWYVNCGAAHGLWDGAVHGGEPLPSDRPDAVRPVGATVEGTRSAEGPDRTGMLSSPAPVPAQNGTQTDSVPGGVGVTEFTVQTGSAPRTVRARRVYADRTLVDLSGWQPPDPDGVHPARLSATALPPGSVRLAAGAGAHREEALLRTALDDAAAGGRAPLLRRGDGRPPAPGVLAITVETAEGWARIRLPAELPAVPDLQLREPADAERVVACLSHVTRWYQLREWDAPASSLAGRIDVEIRPWGEQELLLPDGDGVYVRQYTGRPGAWQEPRVSIRLRNRSAGEALWCLLVDLTDSYAADPQLFPGHFVGPGHTGFALDGEPVWLTLPLPRVRPGAYVRDWLKLVVARGELNTAPFHLPPWDPGAGASERGSLNAGTDGVLRLTPPLDRNAGRRTPVGEWAARTLPLRTEIPDDGF
ncbi:caspase family protein [Streptomyces sp. NPDC093094]|uniref:caspase family protein n=1 Tax=Streptomyces sp. NPDC093094 TaxID=3366026 RepID=UPI0038177348